MLKKSEVLDDLVSRSQKNRNMPNTIEGNMINVQTEMNETETIRT